jgi:adenylate cyclase
MREETMRAGLQTILTSLALGGILLAAGGVHFAWWRTAMSNSTALAGEIERQVTASVRREWWARVTSAEAAYGIAAGLVAGATGPAREAALALPTRHAPALSALIHVDDRGETLAAHRGADNHVTVTRAFGSWPDEPGEAQWIAIDRDPVTSAPAVAYAGRLPDGGRLGAVIALSQFSRFLSEIAVGRTGGAFVLDGGGRVMAGPADRSATPLLSSAAQAAGDLVAARPTAMRDVTEHRSLTVAGEPFAVALSPLHFRGWQFAVIIPEADFLGEIDATTRMVGIALALAIAVAALVAALAARHLLVRPIHALVADLGHVQRFQFEALAHRRSHIAEVDQLSGAIARMAAGLASFGRYIPVDLVRDLVAQGMRAEPGGETREVTVMFADLAGFTGLAERLGADAVPLAGRFLELASHSIEQTGGTIDKFIGDAVMALWGAPRPDAQQALHACRAALALVEALEHGGVSDDAGAPLKVRIGIGSGDALVGNIGSRTRLNYTAVGDSVNLASRLEGANKLFGTAILISEATRAAADTALITREVDCIAVYGRRGGVTVHELVGLAPATRPAWIDDYEQGLAAYRRRDFTKAMVRLENCLARKPMDGPAMLLAARCRALIAEAPPGDWTPVFILEAK